MRILIIRPGAIGDALLAFHILKILRARYADPHITLVSNAGVLPLALAFDLAEEVSDYADVAWSELFSAEGIRSPTMQDQLRQTDLTICWLHDPHGVVEHNLLNAGVKQIVVAPGRPGEGQHMHVVDYLAGTIGLQHGAMDTSTPFTTPGSETCIVGAGLAPALPTPALPDAVAIHPGSGSTHKCWPACNFTAVIEQLTQRNIPVLLLAGPADTERVHDMLGHLSAQRTAGMLKVLENAPLLEVADHLQQCTGYLGNDSGITHLAAMLGIPSLALFGPSDPVTWRPVGPFVRVIQEYPLDRLHVNVAIDTMNSFYLNRTIEGYRTSGMGTVHNIEISSILDTSQTEN